MNERYDMNPTKRELLRDLNDIILRLMFFSFKGDWGSIEWEAGKYHFMWEMWVEAVYGGYGNPPEPEYHRGLIEPIWFRDWQKRHP